VCVCSFSYPVFIAREQYYDLWPVWLYNILYTLSHKRHDFRREGGGVVTEREMCVLIFFANFLEDSSDVL